MFVSRKYHEKALAELHKQYEARLDALNESHLSLLSSYKHQIEDLRKLVFPTPLPTISRESLEADSVLSASEKSPEMSEEERTKILMGERELDLVLSGNYDSDLLQ